MIFSHIENLHRPEGVTIRGSTLSNWCSPFYIGQFNESETGQSTPPKSVKTAIGAVAAFLSIA